MRSPVKLWRKRDALKKRKDTAAILARLCRPTRRWLPDKCAMHLAFSPIQLLLVLSS